MGWLSKLVTRLLSKIRHSAAPVNDFGGQDPYPRFGADDNDANTEVPDAE